MDKHDSNWLLTWAVFTFIVLIIGISTVLGRLNTLDSKVEGDSLEVLKVVHGIELILTTEEEEEESINIQALEHRLGICEDQLKSSFALLAGWERR